MATVVASVTDLCLAAKAAARPLAATPSAVKDAALRAIAEALETRVDEILEANARDLEAGRGGGGAGALVGPAAPAPPGGGGGGGGGPARAPPAPPPGGGGGGPPG